jgi:starch phosphorylase
MFADYKVDAITNGVDVPTWAAPSFQNLFDRRIPGWRQDNLMLRYALGISVAEIWDAHIQAKRALLARVNSETHAQMDEDVFTVGFARRATPYKRADLLFHDVERLKAIAARVGKLQILYAGKAHPNDKGGKELIHHVFEASEALRDSIKVIYLPNYDLRL